MRAFLIIGWFASLIAFGLLELRPPDKPAVALLPHARLYARTDTGPDILHCVSDRISVRFGQLVESFIPLDSVIHRSPCAGNYHETYTAYRPRSRVARPDTTNGEARKRRWIDQPTACKWLT